MCSRDEEQRASAERVSEAEVETLVNDMRRTSLYMGEPNRHEVPNTIVAKPSPRGCLKEEFLDTAEAQMKKSKKKFLATKWSNIREWVPNVSKLAPWLDTIAEDYQVQPPLDTLAANRARVALRDELIQTLESGPESDEESDLRDNPSPWLIWYLVDSILLSSYMRFVA
ncbi:hypothetical protein GQ53DRAFT_803745 [Thozetella sp. PMI_491]|nr:hypothetical protein GQ53DRAFT_803745 [Thozetella sp. PMI_491]